MKALFILPIKIYQICVSPLVGSCCRFYPSCSQYMIEAIQERGVITGVGLGIKRVAKCHPFHAGGVDFVQRIDTQKGQRS